MSGTVASCNIAYHGTLTASQVDQITVTVPVSRLEVVNRSGTAEIYFTVGPTGTPAPTVGGNDTYMVPAAIGSFEAAVAGATLVVQLISSGSPNYSVIAGQAA